MHREAVMRETKPQGARNTPAPVVVRRLRRVTAVAWQSLRTAIRGRFAASLAALLALVMLALPVLVPGDGTPEGSRRILLAWAPGLATILLGAASLWAGCGALATEIEEGTWNGLATTPAARLELWLGKWLGLVAIDAALLAGALGLAAAQARLRGVPAEALRPYAVVAPDETAFREQAHDAAARMIAAGVAGDRGAATNVEALAAVLLSDLHATPVALSAGESFRWRFAVNGDRGLRPGEAARVSLEVVSPFGTAAQMTGRLAAYAETPESGGDATLDAKPLAVRIIVPDDDHTVRLDLPTDALAGLHAVRVELNHTGAADAPAALVDVPRGVRLLLPRDSLAGNLLRVWAVQLSLLALLAAIGTATGAMFTRPVAVFVATAVAALGILSHAGFDEVPVHAHDHGGGASSHAAEVRATVARAVLHRIAATTRPVTDAAALDRLGDSLLVEARPVRDAVALDGILLPLLCGVLSALVLRRREP